VTSRWGIQPNLAVQELHPELNGNSTTPVLTVLGRKRKNMQEYEK